jgi:adenylate cyclase class 2
LRDANGNFSFNYKEWNFDENNHGLYADVFETKIENLKMAEKILASIDAKPIITVEKNRKVYNYKDYEVSLDSVKGLGDFVELEYIGKRDVAEHKEIVAEMVKFLKDTGCGRLEVNNSGYPELLLFGREGRFEVL